MPRQRKNAATDSAPPVPIVPALLIELNAVYRSATIQAALGLGGSALRAEWRAGRLRVIRRCNRNFLLGRDILDWLDRGELLSPAKRHERNGAV
jgi:hypothetical protein